jgi:hypothetical protein
MNKNAMLLRACAAFMRQTGPQEPTSFSKKISDIDAGLLDKFANQIDIYGDTYVDVLIQKGTQP